MAEVLTRADMRGYQHRATDFIKQHDACALWADMGLGKSVATLTAFLDLYNTFDARRMLVIAPLRVARTVWDAEVSAWAHLTGLTVSKIVGTAAERKAALRVPADIHTINMENLCWLEQLFIHKRKQIRRWPWETVVLDESHYFKAQSTERFKAMRRLRKLTPRLIELTGTPIPNMYGDLWAQLFLLDKGARLGTSEDAFRQRWFNPPSYESYTWTLRPHAEKEIQDLVKDIVLTLRQEDYLDLPPVMDNFIKVVLPPDKLAQYRKFEKTSVLPLKDKVITAVNAGALNTKLLQLANGSIYIDDKQTWELLHDEKLNALMELLDGAQGPVLIAYAFKSDLQRIKAIMPKLCGKRKTWAILNSDKSIADWNRGEIDYFLLHPASAGPGLNLQPSGSEMIVWFSGTPNLGHYQQLNARLTGGHRRVGKNIVVHHLVTEHTVDEDMIALLNAKATVQNELKLALVKARVEAYS